MSEEFRKIFVSPQEVFTRPAAERSNTLVVRAMMVLAVLFAMFSTQAFAQINTATLSGAVKDTSGAVVPGATVVVTETATGTKRNDRTNESGLFTVPLLQPGVYTVTVTKPGFETAIQPNIELQVNQQASLTFTLTVGSVNQSVTVTGATAQLETETAGLGTVVEPKEIDDLPLNGRQFIQLLQLAPGTVPVSVSQTAVPTLGSGGSNVTPTINGQTGRSNLFFVDGLYATDPFFSTLSISPAVDAIQEFQEQTHTDQSQFGGSTGGTVNLATKGGTNQFHGSAYEFFRNQSIQATPYFATTKGAFKQNQYGGTLGGPIVRGKLFFFGYYDGFRYNQAATNFATLPTSAMLGGDFSALLPGTVLYDPYTYDSTTQTILPFGPSDTVNPSSGPNIIPAGLLNQGILTVLKAYLPSSLPSTFAPNNFTNTAPATTNQDQYSARVDYDWDPKDALMVRWTVNEATQTSPGGLPINPFVTGFNGNNSGGSWVHTFSPTLVSQITAGYNSINHPQTYLTPNAGSLFEAAGFSAGFAENPGDVLVPEIVGIHPSGFFDVNGGWGPIGPQRLYQISGSVNKQAGKHALTFGAAYYYTWMYTNWAENDVSFNQEATWNPCSSTSAGACVGAGGNSLASMMIGLPNSASRQLGNSGVNLYDHLADLFVQDTWRVAQNLTVNYGMRWDVTTPVGETNNRLATFDVNDSLYSSGLPGTWLIPKDDSDTPKYPLPNGVAISNRNPVTLNDWTNFSPRLGLSYQATPTTVVSAGLGVTYDNWSGAEQSAQNARGAWPSGASQNPSNLNIAGVTPGATAQNPFGNSPPVIPTTPFPSGGGFVDTRFKIAYSWQWNLQIQKQLGTSGVAKVAYVGSATSRSPVQVPFNISTVLGPTQVLPFPQMHYGFSEIQSIGHVSYNAFQAQYSKRYSGGLSVITAFTWSKDINVGCSDFWEGCNIENPYDMRTNRGVSLTDVPFVFTFSSVYELPFGKGKSFANSGPAAVAFGGWQINGILSTRSGTPFTPGINFDNENANGGNERPDVTGSTHGPKTLAEWFNTSAYFLPPPYTYGDAGRDSLRGPGYTDVDFSLFRNFTFAEHYTVQFRAEAFNLFNHPNFNNPDATLEDPTFGVISSANSPREYQFAGTFRF